MILESFRFSFKDSSAYHNLVSVAFSLAAVVINPLPLGKTGIARVSNLILASLV